MFPIWQLWTHDGRWLLGSTVSLLSKKEPGFLFFFWVDRWPPSLSQSVRSHDVRFSLFPPSLFPALLKLHILSDEGKSNFQSSLLFFRGFNCQLNFFPTMALNPQYDAIGQAFAQQYYSIFDDATQRANLINFYNVNILIHRSFACSYIWLNLFTGRDISHDVWGTTTTRSSKNHGKV